MSTAVVCSSESLTQIDFNKFPKTEAGGGDRGD